MSESGGWRLPYVKHWTYRYSLSAPVDIYIFRESKTCCQTTCLYVTAGRQQPCPTDHLREKSSSSLKITGLVLVKSGWRTVDIVGSLWLHSPGCGVGLMGGWCLCWNWEVFSLLWAWDCDGIMLGEGEIIHILRKLSQRCIADLFTPAPTLLM